MAEKRPNFWRDRDHPEHPDRADHARSGIDWIISISNTARSIRLRACDDHGDRGTPCVPMVRIAANEPWLAKAPMDLGALGINFPMICSRADAEKAVRSVRYPPKGDRLWGVSRPFRWGVSMPDTWQPPTTT